jgi:hypothetical protein
MCVKQVMCVSVLCTALKYTNVVRFCKIRMFRVNFTFSSNRINDTERKKIDP